MNNRQYMDEENARKIYQTFSQVYITKEPASEFEFEVIRKDGTKLFAACSVSLIMDAKGQPTGFRGIIRNVTEYKKAEETLRQSEGKYRTILESIEHGYFEVDIRGNYTFFNDSMCEIIRYSRDEMMGMNNRQFMDKQNAKKMYQTFNGVYTTGKPAQGFDWELIRKDGTKRFVEASVSLVRDAQGKPAGFRGVVRDITERKRAEEKLRRSEEKYRTILENITDGYYEIDLAGNFTFFNDSMCKIGGYTRDEMMGMNNRQYMDKNTAKRVYQTFTKVYTTGKPSRGFDWEFTRKDGTKRIVEGSISLIRDAQGKPAGFRGVVRDITERKQMEAERAEMERRSQLASRLSTVGKMASGILHEVNNPLTSIIGFSQLLAQQDLPEDTRKYATIIKNQGQRAANIVSRIVDFARYEKPERVYTDINKLIKNTLELQVYEMEASNIKVTTQLDPDLPRTTADPGQLQQVFLNIILNAMTEMQSVHGKGKFLVKTEAIDHTIRISFEDDGPGIAKQNLERIFEPFFTTKEVGTATGLGLSICHEIIANHNGQLYARSTLGKGATFTIELPVVARQRKTATTARANPITFGGS